MYSPLQHVYMLHEENCSLENAHTPCVISLKSQENKPQHSQGGRREIILMRKENCSWLMSSCLESVRFKNAPENFADKHGHRV